jgi:hypothetical protein
MAHVNIVNGSAHLEIDEELAGVPGYPRGLGSRASRPSESP